MWTPQQSRSRRIKGLVEASSPAVPMLSSNNNNSSEPRRRDPLAPRRVLGDISNTLGAQLSPAAEQLPPLQHPAVATTRKPCVDSTPKTIPKRFPIFEDGGVQRAAALPMTSPVSSRQFSSPRGGLSGASPHFARRLVGSVPRCGLEPSSSDRFVDPWVDFGEENAQPPEQFQQVMHDTPSEMDDDQFDDESFDLPVDSFQERAHSPDFYRKLDRMGPEGFGSPKTFAEELVRAAATPWCPDDVFHWNCGGPGTQLPELADMPLRREAGPEAFDLSPLRPLSPLGPLPDILSDSDEDMEGQA